MKANTLFVALLAVAGASWMPVGQAAELVVAGSTTVQKRVLEPGAEALKKATGIEVKVQGVGTGKGMIALAEGKVSVAAASESLAEAIDSGKKAAADQGKSYAASPNLKFHKLYTDSIVVVVHKDNPVSSLSKDQIKAINTGKVRNWKEVGGSDLPIKVVTSHAGSATRNVFQKQIMDGTAFVDNVTEVRTTREEINEVSKDKGGIGAVSEGFFEINKGSTKVVKAPAITRPLGLITDGEASPDVKKVVDFFVSGAGKGLIQ